MGAIGLVSAKRAKETLRVGQRLAPVPEITPKDRRDFRLCLAVVVPAFSALFWAMWSITS